MLERSSTRSGGATAFVGPSLPQSLPLTIDSHDDGGESCADGGAARSSCALAREDGKTGASLSDWFDQDDQVDHVEDVRDSVFGSASQAAKDEERAGSEGASMASCFGAAGAARPLVSADFERQAKRGLARYGHRNTPSLRHTFLSAVGHIRREEAASLSGSRNRLSTSWRVRSTGSSEGLDSSPFFLRKKVRVWVGCATSILGVGAK
jgi:hypothetical protein